MSIVSPYLLADAHYVKGCKNAALQKAPSGTIDLGS